MSFKNESEKWGEGKDIAECLWLSLELVAIHSERLPSTSMSLRSDVSRDEPGA